MAFDNIHLEKGMYHEAGRSFTQVLEQLDPSEGYRGTPLENTGCLPAPAQALRHPREGRGLGHGGEILLHVRIRRAVPGIPGPRRAPGYGRGQHPARHYGDGHAHRRHGLPQHLLRAGGGRPQPCLCGRGRFHPRHGHPHARAPRPSVQARQNARGVL